MTQIAEGALKLLLWARRWLLKHILGQNGWDSGFLWPSLRVGTLSPWSPADPRCAGWSTGHHSVCPASFPSLCLPVVGLQTCLTFLLLLTLPVPPLFRSALPRGSRPRGARRDTYWVQGRLSGGREVGRMHWYCFPQPAGLLWPFSLGALLCSLAHPSEQFSQQRGCFPPIEEKSN